MRVAQAARSSRAILRRIGAAADAIRAKDGERWLFALTLALAAALRLALAATGWPALNSDEATVGLMADDILRYGAHPVFYYGQNYMGALQAYLAVPFFVLLGPTNFALAAVATFQTILFLLVLFLLTRAVFSPLVAWGTLLLLALGPIPAYLGELSVGIGQQDTLLFGALVVALAVLRLRRPVNPRVRFALDAALGLAVGLGVWGDFLFLPYVVAAGVALGVEGARAIRRSRRAAGQTAHAARMRRYVTESGVVIGGAIVGALPLIAANVASHGLTFAQLAGIASFGGSSEPSARSALAAHVQAIGAQIAATLVTGLPHQMGRDVLCAPCTTWPMPAAGVAAPQLVWSLLVSLAFLGVGVGCWALAALPLARDVRFAWRERRTRRDAGGTVSEAGGTPALHSPAPILADGHSTDHDIFPRWWGRAMLVIGSALTVVQFMASSASYAYPVAATRYLTGIYLAAPLVVVPLVAGAAAVLRWLAGRASGETSPPRPRLSRFLGAGLLVAVFVLQLAGIQQMAAATADPASHGVPMGGRDRQLIGFLENHHLTQFYTGYWSCHKLAFESDQRLDCAVMRDADAFALGQNRIKAMALAVGRAPHPAYVIDTTNPSLSSLPAQLAAHIAAGDRRVAGYRVAAVAGYLVYYSPDAS